MSIDLHLCVITPRFLQTTALSQLSKSR